MSRQNLAWQSDVWKTVWEVAFIVQNIGGNMNKESETRNMFILLFILVWVIPLMKEEAENQNYREQCRRRGDKTYWSTDGLRYTNSNQKVYKQQRKLLIFCWK